MMKPWFWTVVVLLVASEVGAAAETEREPEEKVVYSCDFEQGTGIFRLEANVRGFAARLDHGVSHSGKQSVKLVDGGGQDAELVWMHEGMTWGAVAMTRTTASGPDKKTLSDHPRVRWAWRGMRTSSV